MSDKDDSHESCGNCKFFLESIHSKDLPTNDERYKRFGHCRRHPPALEPKMARRYPDVIVNEWCGEWK